MRQLTLAVSRLFNIFIVLTLLSACSTSLVPQYQQSLVDGVNQANLQATTLFATLGNGSSAAEYPKLASRYDDIIGAFDAVRVQVEARGWPTVSAPLLNLGPLKQLCPPSPGEKTTCSGATEDALANIVDNFTTLKAMHQAHALGPSIVAGRKTRYEAMMRVVLQVENYLKR